MKKIIKTDTFVQKHEVLCAFQARHLRFLNILEITIISMRAILGFKKPVALFFVFSVQMTVHARLLTQGVALRMQRHMHLKTCSSGTGHALAAPSGV